MVEEDLLQTTAVFIDYLTHVYSSPITHELLGQTSANRQPVSKCSINRTAKGGQKHHMSLLRL